MLPWFIATETFTPHNAEAWAKYVSWSHLNHLDEVVSLDPMLCPTVLPEIKDEYCMPRGFEFLGYDLVDVEGSASALTNCGGFPDVFDNRELSSKGLLTSFTRAVQVQSELRAKHPEEDHADCHLWAVARWRLEQ